MEALGVGGAASRRSGDDFHKRGRTAKAGEGLTTVTKVLEVVEVFDSVALACGISATPGNNL